MLVSYTNYNIAVTMRLKSITMCLTSFVLHTDIGHNVKREAVLGGNWFIADRSDRIERLQKAKNHELAISGNTTLHVAMGAA